MANKAIIYIFAAAGIAVLLFLCWFGYTAYKLFFWFGLEDRFVGTYRPVTEAISSYQQDNNSLPSDINVLVPKYISTIPKLKQVKSFKYNIIDPNDWELIAIVEAKGIKKEFIYRTTFNLTPDEQKRLWTGCHDWFVLLIQN